MAAGDSRNKALEGQPCFLRPKELRHGTESRVLLGHWALGGFFSGPQPGTPDILEQALRGVLD
ncbi:MAG: hypothetical protein OEY53_01970, partial [Gammaproteobacteria bacterium]|nr:hypothetical protein [Gammaproteobacteria bacterium]